MDNDNVQVELVAQAGSPEADAVIQRALDHIAQVKAARPELFEEEDDGQQQ